VHGSHERVRALLARGPSLRQSTRAHGAALPLLQCAGPAAPARRMAGAGAT